MYRSFRARNFRCFADLQVGDLARINLIAVMNNVGKTALLEAVFRVEGVRDVQVQPIGGKSLFPASLAALRATSHFRSIVRSAGGDSRCGR